MKQFFTNFLFSLFLLVVLATTSLVRPPVASAQTCAQGEALCALDDILNLSIFNNDRDACVRIVCAIQSFYDRIPDNPPPLPWYEPRLREFYDRVHDGNPDEIFGERYTYAQVNWIIHSLLIHFLGPIPFSSNAEELVRNLASVIDTVNMVIEFFQGGESGDGASSPRNVPNLAALNQFGVAGQTFAGLVYITNSLDFQRTVSGVGEVKKFFTNLSLISPVSAQGTGYSRLNMSLVVNQLWTATRNMAYLVSSILIIAAGFMVIFRTRLSPQLSVSIQMVIPRIAISLFLVTFSYAIAGFVIDLIYVVISLVIGMISLTTGTNIIDNPIAAITQLSTNFNFVNHFLGIWIGAALFLLVGTVIITIVAAAIPGMGTLGIVAVPILGMILGIVMWSIYVWARIVGQLIVAYISLNLLVIGGPLMIIFDILPNSKGAFKKWLMCVIGNASVFLMYILMAILAELSFNLIQPLQGFNDTFPRLLAGNVYTLPGFIYPDNLIFSYLVFMGFMTFVPTVVNSVKNMFCKTSDIGDFVQNSVKDTIGQFSKAGENAGKSITEYKRDQARQKDTKTNATD